jgi:hypothetical protein
MMYSVAKPLAALAIGNGPCDYAPHAPAMHFRFLGSHRGAVQDLLKRPMQLLGSLSRSRLIAIGAELQDDMAMSRRFARGGTSDGR